MCSSWPALSIPLFFAPTQTLSSKHASTAAVSRSLVRPLTRVHACAHALPRRHLTTTAATASDTGFHIHTHRHMRTIAAPLWGLKRLEAMTIMQRTSVAIEIDSTTDVSWHTHTHRHASVLFSSVYPTPQHQTSVFSALARRRHSLQHRKASRLIICQRIHATAFVFCS